MLCGLPCVTTPAGSIGELARDGVTAVVVKAEDAADLERGLLAALADATLRERLGGAARRHCAENFGRDRMLDRMERVLLGAAGSVK
jgi:glycosyltransferase involved in cell wall biosynthesis